MCTFAKKGLVGAASLAFALAVGPGDVWAQGEDTSPSSNPTRPLDFDAGIGLAAGGSTGIGLHLRASIKQDWAFSLTGGPTLWEDGLGASVGLQAMRSVWKRGILRSYALVGTHYYGYRERFYLPFVGSTIASQFHALGVGTGLGIEGQLGPFSMVFELPVVAVIRLTSDSHLRFPGRVNFAMFPTFAFCIYFGAFRRWHKSKPLPHPTLRE